MQKYFHVRESNNGIHTNKGDKWKIISIDTAKAFDKKILRCTLKIKTLASSRDKKGFALLDMYIFQPDRTYQP